MSQKSPYLVTTNDSESYGNLKSVGGILIMATLHEG